MQSVATLKKLGTHLLQAAVAGVDVLREAVAEHTKKEVIYTVVLAGNDNTGKTTLLYHARFGPQFNKKLIVPTVGHNMETLEFSRRLNGKNVPVFVEVVDHL